MVSAEPEQFRSAVSRTSVVITCPHATVVAWAEVSGRTAAPAANVNVATLPILCFMRMRPPRRPEFRPFSALSHRPDSLSLSDLGHPGCLSGKVTGVGLNGYSLITLLRLNWRATGRMADYDEGSVDRRGPGPAREIGAVDGRLLWSAVYGCRVEQCGQDGIGVGEVV